MLRLLVVFAVGALLGATVERVVRRVARSVPSGQERWESLTRDLAASAQRTLP